MRKFLVIVSLALGLDALATLTYFRASAPAFESEPEVFRFATAEDEPLDLRPNLVVVRAQVFHPRAVDRFEEAFDPVVVPPELSIVLLRMVTEKRTLEAEPTPEDVEALAFATANGIVDPDGLPDH